MASSSVSQEDVDNDFELSSRRTRIRTARACRNANPPPPTNSVTSSSSITAIPPSALASRIIDHHNLGCGADHPDEGNLDGTGNLGSCLAGGELRNTEGGDHNDASPKPLGRAKEKRVNRANHLNKGKQQRDRRKLREKRRSTGVVHLPSTESTGGSTGEDEDEGGAGGVVLSQCPLAAETRRNTHHNEHLLLERTGAPDGNVQSENNERAPVKQFTQRRNKSPSDLEADDEDNQEFDSLNQSDSATGSAPHPPTPTATVAPLPPLHHPHHTHHHHHHHHHHRHQSASSQSVHSTSSPPVQQGEKVPNGNRPGTPTGENMEELLERAQEENRRLLRLLEERDRRIACLEAKVNSLHEEKEEILRQVARTGIGEYGTDGDMSRVIEAAHGERVPTEEGEGISKV